MPAPDIQSLCVLGSTGSIGTQTLDLVRAYPQRLTVASLTANTNGELLVRQAREFQPARVALIDKSAYDYAKRELAGTNIEVLFGPHALKEVAACEDATVVVAAIVGFAGLHAVMAALERGARIALANKETLVVAGALVRRELERHGGEILPVDSEHSAIFQCLQGEPDGAINKLILTASGGPFRTRQLDSFGEITLEEALKHPNWSMGAKITVDSATMMNKGLEVVEAHWLFGVDVDKIDVLIHPQSIVHSFVNFRDGSTKAQLGIPDMRVPIQYALSYPDRWESDAIDLDWSQIKTLDFDKADYARYPSLELAYNALRDGGSSPAVLNAANEQAVALFLERKIRFVDIARLVESALGSVEHVSDPSIADLIEIDSITRSVVLEHKLGSIH